MAPTVIPLPLHYEALPGQCKLPRNLLIGCCGQGALDIGSFLASYLTDSLQLDAHAQSADARSNNHRIYLCCTESPQLADLPNNDEAYELLVAEDGVRIQGSRPHGVFNGVQSLIQLLPSQPPQDPEILLECLQVKDAPSYRWRGMLLDVGRHFFEVPFILKLLDVCALYKVNKFHWHLTDDQGWRLEIKRYSRLTEFGAWRGGVGDGEAPYGGFYTQEQVRHIVAYAAERFIEVVPEIELPGHCGAAIACYPHLSCQQAAMEVPTQWGVHEDVYCAGREETFAFLEGVLEEVLELFPSRYIHIGGDECPKVRWAACEDCQRRLRLEKLADEFALQSWFIARIGSWLAARQRSLIGWDEILEGGLAPGAIVMSWRGILGGIRAAKAGHQVIMTPTNHCYLDYKQSLREDEPGAWFAVLSLETAYAFDPTPFPHTEVGTAQSTYPQPTVFESTPVAPGAPLDAPAGPIEAPAGSLSMEGPASSQEMSISAAAAPNKSSVDVQGGPVNAEESSPGPAGSAVESDMAVTSGPAGGSTAMSRGSEATGEVTMGTGLAKEEEEMLRMVEGDVVVDGVGEEVDMERGPEEEGLPGTAQASTEEESYMMVSRAEDSGGPAITDEHMAFSDDGAERSGTERDPVLLSGESHLTPRGVTDEHMAGCVDEAVEQVSGAPEPDVALLSGDSQGTPRGRGDALHSSGSSTGASGTGVLREGRAEEVKEGTAIAASRGRCGTPVPPGGLVSIMIPTTYPYGPEYILAKEHAVNIIGGQANVWTEYISEEKTVEYMLLPRLCALAEAMWTPRAARDWPGFRSRLAAHLPHLDARGFDYHPL
eukprot:jgi/Botrbrau1/11875/Bobra.126_2s0010.1